MTQYPFGQLLVDEREEKIKELEHEKSLALKYATKQRKKMKRGQNIFSRPALWEKRAEEIQEQINELKNEKDFKTQDKN